MTTANNAADPSASAEIPARAAKPKNYGIAG
jgi:hypothetical protein